MRIIYDSNLLYETSGLKGWDELLFEIAMMVEKNNEVFNESLINLEFDNQSEIDHYNKERLRVTDWKVIRALEQLYLSENDIHLERQAWRDSIS